MTDPSDRQAVVTGLGVVAPNGVGWDTWWQATKEGKSGIARLDRFAAYDTQLAGEVASFDPADYLDAWLIMQTDRATQLALAAAHLALRDAAFEPGQSEPRRMGAATASTMGGVEFAQRELQNLWDKGPGFVSAYQSIASFPAASAAQIALRYGMKGSSSVVAAGESGGLEALQEARRALRRGMRMMLSGGTEAPLTPLALAALGQSGQLSTERQPKAAYRPFDERACGYVPGEGGAMLLVESLAAARQRRAPRLYGVLAGYGASQDGNRHAEPGRQLARAMALALQNAGMEPEDVDVVFADASGVPERDAAEAQAIRDVFGERAGEIPVTAPKSMTGRLFAGAAPLDVAAALLAMRDGCIPPTLGFSRPAPGGELNVVRQAQEAKIGAALVVARGAGGFNSALVVRRLDD